MLLTNVFENKANLDANFLMPYKSLDSNKFFFPWAIHILHYEIKLRPKIWNFECLNVSTIQIDICYLNLYFCPLIRTQIEYYYKLMLIGLIKLYGSQCNVKHYKMFCSGRYHFKKHGQVFELVHNIQDLFNIPNFQKAQDFTRLLSQFHFSKPFVVFTWVTVRLWHGKMSMQM